MKACVTTALTVLVALSLISFACGRSLADLAGKVSNNQYPWASLGNDTENGSIDSSYRNYYLRQHALFLSELNETREAGKDLDLVWYGDSLLQCLRYEADVCMGAIAAYQKYILSSYTSALWAIGSDTVENLMWRLLNGERPSGIGAKLAILQIGVNDISTWTDTVLDNEAQGLADRLLEIAEYLAATEAQTQVLVLGFLPRGPGFMNQSSQPSRFTEPIVAVNSEIENGIKDLEKVHFLDCSPLMLNPGGDIDQSLMPDALHPSGKGYEVLLRDCWRPVIDQLVEHTKTTVPAAVREAALKLNGTDGANDHDSILENMFKGNQTDSGVAGSPTPSGHCTCPSPYKLSHGESLDGIAAKCGTTVDAIGAANGVDWSKPVNLGKEILIPGCGGVLQRNIAG